MSFKEYVDHRLMTMCEAPPMWGSREAVELQAILLMECELLHYNEKKLTCCVRIVLDTYLSELQRAFRRSTAPLHILKKDASDEEFGRALFEICARVRRDLASPSKEEAQPTVTETESPNE